MCAQRRLRSAWASAQSDQSLRCALLLVLSCRSSNIENFVCLLPDVLGERIAEIVDEEEEEATWGGQFAR